MSTRRPLSVVVRPKGSAFIKAFIASAQDAMRNLDSVTVEESGAGLLIEALWELDLEGAIQHLRDALNIELECSKPKIHFLEKDKKIFEPVMRFSVSVPEDCIGAVYGEFIKRRGFPADDKLPVIEPTVKLKMCMPLAEMFGLPTSLRAMSGGKATISGMELMGYEPGPPPPGPHGPVANEMRA
jgi:translation elongation factor EF-G